MTAVRSSTRGDAATTRLTLPSVDILEFSMVQANEEFAWFRARHSIYGAVTLKCCHQNASIAAIAKLRWEFFVTRQLVGIGGVIIPQNLLHDFEWWPFGLILPEFPLTLPPDDDDENMPQNGSPALKTHSREGSHSTSAAQTDSDSMTTSVESATSHLSGAGSAHGASELLNENVSMTLGDYLRQENVITLDQATTLLRRLALILRDVHRAGVMYKSFSYDTVILQFTAGDRLRSDWSNVRFSLCDFSLASKLTGEQMSPVAAEVHSHSDVRFMSPESTGRTNRSVDFRSDVYGLGMLIHSALTGTSPPKSTSLLNMIHYHVAVVPIPLQEFYAKYQAHSRSVSFMRRAANLQQLLDRMIAKLPEKRYRSCDDILHDLERLMSDVFQLRQFTPRIASSADIVLDNSQLFGRSREIEQLLAFQEKVNADPVGGVVSISGVSGVGKTSLVQELVMPTFKASGVYCFGKHNQLKRDSPFFAISKACTDLINLLLIEEQSTLSRISEQLTLVLTDNWQALANILPNLHYLMKLSSPPAPFSTYHPTEMLERTERALTSFLATVAAFKPLVMFIDDVQWADSSSIRFLLQLATQGMPRHMLLVIAYRSEEAHLCSALSYLTAALRANNEPQQYHFLDIQLSDMQLSDIADMLNALVATADKVGELATLVYEKTRGNPFYVRRFLQAAIEMQALRLSPDGEQFVWDLDKIRQALPTDNVVDMLALELRALPEQYQLVLMLAAMLGATFDVGVLAQLMSTTDLVVWELLLFNHSKGYVRSLDGTHPFTEQVDSSVLTIKSMEVFHRSRPQDNARWLPKLDEVTLDRSDLCLTLASSLAPSASSHDQEASRSRTPSGSSDHARSISSSRIRFQWTHDRIQQAAYQLIPSDQRQRAHLNIGCWLLERHDINNLGDDVFDIAHHLSQAAALLTNSGDKVNLAKILLVASSTAHTRSAFAASLMYSQTAVDQLPDDAWQQCYDIAFAAHHMLIEAERSNLNYSRMKQLSAEIRTKQLSKHHLALIDELDMHYHISQVHPEEAVECGLAALAALGQALPREDTSVLMRSTTLPLTEIPKLADLPLLSNRVVHVAARVLVTLISPVYWTTPHLVGQLIISLVNISKQYGNSDYGCYGYCMYGLLLIGHQNDTLSAYEYGKLGMKILERVSPTPLKGPVFKVYASHILPWVEPLRNVYACFATSIAASKLCMNAEYTGYGIAELLHYKFFGGVPLRTLNDEAESHRETIASIQQAFSSTYLALLCDAVRHLSNKRCKPTKHFISQETQTTIVTGKVLLVNLVYWQTRLMLHCLGDEIAEALECVAEGDTVMHAHIGSMFYSEYLLFKGVALIRGLMMNLVPDPKVVLADIRDIIAKYAVWAEHCHSTFACRLELLSGCAEWLQGDVMRGLNHLDRAIDLARQHGFVNIQALANELTAKLWVWCGKKPLAGVYLKAAFRCYKAWGAHWKAEQYRRYEERGGSPNVSDDEEMAEIYAAPSHTTDETDFEMICNWTVALASEKTNEALLEQFIRLCTLYSGARKSFLFWATDTIKGVDDLSSMTMTASAMVNEDGALRTRLYPEDIAIDLAPIANYALRTKEVVSDSSAVVDTFRRSGHVPPRCGSFLFYPILRHGVCIGLLCLYNRLSRRAFANTKRASLLKLLSSQLNISLENMRLLEELRTYNEALQAQTITLEELVKQRTQALELTNRELVQQVVEREKAEAVAVQAAQANRSFLHTMSHELRTPLNCIIGMTELLSQMQISAEQLELLRPIQSSAKDLLQIINDILDLSKIESGKLVLSKEDCCLREIIENSADSVSSQAAEKSITVITLYPANVPSRIHHDGTRIGQVLRNLLSNAIKFTPQGEVVVEVSASAPNDAGTVVFTVRCTDTGIGIPEEQMDKLFKPFSQIDCSLSRKYGGTGLGLNISKKFAQILSGDLTCESKLGQGSTFTFTFEAGLLPEQTSPANLPHNLTFVLCHPSPLVRQMVTGYLQFDGHRVHATDVEGIAQYQPPPAQRNRTVYLLDKQSIDMETIKQTTVPKILLSETDKPGDLTNETTTFVVRIPLRRSRLLSIVSAIFSQTHRTVGRAPQAQRPHFSLRVLMAEDNAVNQSMAERMLRKFGISVVSVVNGALAVEACKDRQWDLILMDVMMPVMDGHQATRIIREAVPKDEQPKIIALTANAFAEDKAMCLEAGMDDYLTKPLTFASLEAMLLRYFSPV
ncbi:hypothetical protein RI367_003291 [Sorochytrium milnesiophthora]